MTGEEDRKCVRCSNPKDPNSKSLCTTCLGKAREYAAAQRSYIPSEELPLFQADPLLEDKRGWTDAIVCRLCRWGGDVLSKHLKAAHPEISVEEYKLRFGYNKTTKLISADYRQRLAELLKKRDARCRSKGLPVFSQRGARPFTARRRPLRTYEPKSREARQHHAVASMGPHPGKRKQDSMGRTVPDWQIAKLRLEGKKLHEIGKSVKPQLHKQTVLDRLRLIGFPLGEPCGFFRGAPVTEKLLRQFYEDLVFLRTTRHSINNYRLGVRQDLAKRLGISPTHLSGLLTGRNGRNGKRRYTFDYPLSLGLCKALLLSIANLRREYKQFAPTAKGGRPKALLPSEEKEIPAKYQALRSDLDLMLRWAELQNKRITLDLVGEWMCGEARHGRLRVLLFWPSLHLKLPAICEQAKNRLRARLGSAERAKEFICEEYGISRGYLVAAIKGQPAPIASAA